MTKKAFFLLYLNDHIQYLQKINETLAGRANFKGVSHRDCKLGQWLYKEGAAEVATMKNPQAQKIFESLIKPHERFHNLSQEALERNQAHDEEGVKAVMAEMRVVSYSIAQKLSELDALDGWE